jgi:phenylacetate-CoA ligase
MPATFEDGLTQLVRHLERSERMSVDQLRCLQFARLGRLAQHWRDHSPSFAARLASAGLSALDLADPSGLAALPVLTRRAMQRAGDALYCRRIPSGHGAIEETHSSGSTGEPVRVLRTGMTEFIRMAFTMRDHLWHRRDLTGRLCAVRGNISSYARHDDWGIPASLLASTGPMLSLPLATDTARLASWIVEFDPTYLLILPATLGALATYCHDHNLSLPSLKEIRTFGETLHPSLEKRVALVFGVPVVDCYSTSEVGYVALMCPVTRLYHVMAEGVIAEVLDERGNPCGEGEIGRVTVTDLHNCATPLARYDIGDYAEVAPACPCGRGLPTWRRILGRERNMVIKPDGSRHWPITGFYRCREIAPIVQYQLVQHDLESVEARLVVERDLTPSEENGLRDHFNACIGGGLTLRFTYVPGRLPTSAGGKFEEFISHVPASAT